MKKLKEKERVRNNPKIQKIDLDKRQIKKNKKLVFNVIAKNFHRLKSLTSI